MEHIIGEFLMEAACGDLDDEMDGFWEYNPHTSVLAFRPVDTAKVTRTWLITAEEVTYVMCRGSGQHWGKSILFGIPHCPHCLQSWSLLGVKQEPATTGNVPPHEAKWLRMR